MLCSDVVSSYDPVNKSRRSFVPAPSCMGHCLHTTCPAQGNATSGVSVGLNTVLEEFTAGGENTCT